MAMTNTERSAKYYLTSKPGMDALRKKYEKTPHSKLIERIWTLMNTAKLSQDNFDVIRKTTVKYQRILGRLSEALTDVCDSGEQNQFRRDIALRNCRKIIQEYIDDVGMNETPSERHRRKTSAKRKD